MIDAARRFEVGAAGRWCALAPWCLLLGMVGCAHRPVGGPIIVREDLRRALLDPDRTLSQRRHTLTFASGAAVGSCADYLQQRRGGLEIGEGVNNRLVASEYLVCDSLELLSHAGAPPAPSAAATDLGRELATRLDLRSFPSSLRPRLDEARPVLTALGPALRTTASEAVLEDPAWTFTIAVVAIGDFEHRQHTDWLLWVSDQAHDGNYRDFQVLVVPDVARPGLLAARSPWPRVD